MRKIITIAAIVVVLALVLALGLAALQSGTFNVRRTASIKAPPDKIFAMIDDFHQWGAWSPYEKLDPAMQRSFSGAASGKGAVYAWDGESGTVGSGRMEITDTSPSSKIVIKLDFFKPLEGHNTAEFTITPQGDSNNVTWAMYGPKPYLSKIMGLFFSMDSMIGKDFETGLANLKAVAEK
ncbi:MAG: SRPBCC family protein [Collimonas sp.]|uniref:SRPBCC family protein n=1 Tax=Collimonas sp. TaxID=1963772 RepID=UPI003267D4F9